MRSILRQPEIRVFLTVWVGQFVSVLGSGLTNFGIGVWIYQQTHAATSISLSMLSAMLPGILFSPIAGVLVDRWDRRVAMMIGNCGSGLGSLALVLLVVTGTLNLWLLYGLMAFSSAFTTLMWPAMSASISLLVPKDHLGRANALQQGAEIASVLVSPLLGAVLYVSYGLQSLLILDISSFAIALGTLAMVRIPRPPHHEEHKKEGLFKEAAFGFVYIHSRKGLLGLLFYFLGLNFIGGFVDALWTPLMLSMFTPKIMGTAESLMGLAGVLGTIFMAVWGGPKRRIYGIIGANTLGGFGTLLMLAHHNWVSYTLAGVIFMFFLPMGNASSQAIWQAKVDPAVQGRVFAIRRMIAWCTSPFGTLLAGPLADKVFNPGMMPGGALAGKFAFVGPGVGAGIRLLTLFAGVGILGMSAAAYGSKKVRNVEHDLADAVQAENGVGLAADRSPEVASEV